MPSSFWVKCGHLITDGGSLVRCRTCPCGYYALLVFVGRSIDGPDGEPNPCYEPGLDIVPVQVIDGKVNYLGGMGISWSGCIEINAQPDEQGRVGHARGCADSWEECVQWDSNWENCLRYETVYYDCYDIDVYRIGGCYDNLDDFEEFVYSKCPEITYPYPSLWQYWYGNRYTSYEAEQCIYQDWDLNNDSWYSYAYFRYIPKAKFHWERYDCNIRIDTNSQVGHQELIYTYYWCDGECRQYDSDWNCIDCDGTMQRQDYYEWVADANAHYIEMPSWGGSNVFTYSWPLCELQQGDPECKCINEYNAYSIAGIEAINNEIDEILEDEESYWIGEDQNLVTTCLNKSYSSRFEPNECWASWTVEGINRKWCYSAKITIEKWDNRVTYDGVHIRIYAVDIKGAGSSGNPSRYPLSVEHSTTVLYDTEMDATWGTQIELPIANNMVNWTLANTPYCNNLGDYESPPRYFPYGSGCQDCERVEISIQVLYAI